MKRFQYHAPQSIDEALVLMADLGQEAHLMAGGTDLLVSMRLQGWAPGHMVDLKRIPSLHRLDYRPGQGLWLGAAVTMRQLETSLIVRERYTALAQAAAQVGSIQVRNRATIGGNVVHASPAADTPPALLVLGARAQIAGPDGKRAVPMEDFFLGPGKTVLHPGELLVGFTLPEPPPGMVSAYHRHTPRRAMDIAVVGVAAQLTPEGPVRLALGAVAPIPLRARAAEHVLTGHQMSKEAIEQAAQAAAGEARPISDLRASAEYRRHLVRVLTRRVLAGLSSEDIGHPRSSSQAASTSGFEPTSIPNRKLNATVVQVNGDTYPLTSSPYRALVDFLRDDLGLTGTKKGCETGDCGACTVLLNDQPVPSCLVLAHEAAGQEIITVEGLTQNEVFQSLQEAFTRHGALQCGFCMPGILVMAAALLTENPHPSETDIRQGIAGNLCRCTGYNRIVEAIASVTR